MNRIDFRSDTVTKPSQEMREFMLSAPVGDDVYQEDPTVNKLEEYSAQLFGKEAALFCSSGTQTNQIAINVHCRPGDEVICSKEAHIYQYEGGGIARNSGTSVALLEGDRGRIKAETIKDYIHDISDPHKPLSRLVSIEDTMNRGGGAIYDFEEIKKISQLCKREGLLFHLDGARLFNTLVETQVNWKEYASHFDSISICLSKGLGAPVGSILLGNKNFIQQARRVRKVFGGGMRQAGIIAAGGLYALQKNIGRLKEDHQHAKMIEATLQKQDWVKNVLPVETNIIVSELHEEYSVKKLIESCEERGMLISAFGKQTFRIVTHLDNDRNEIEKSLEILKSIPLHELKK